MAHKTHKRHKRKGFRFEVKVERGTVLHDLADQALRFDYADRDMLYYSGNLEQKNTFDELVIEHGPDIRRERRNRLRQRRMLGI
jgi:hypothetical protein